MCERNINWLPRAHPQWGTWPEAQARALKGNWTGDLSVCRQVLNPLSRTSQGWLFYIISSTTGLIDNTGTKSGNLVMTSSTGLSRDTNPPQWVNTLSKMMHTLVVIFWQSQFCIIFPEVLSAKLEKPHFRWMFFDHKVKTDLEKKTLPFYKVTSLLFFFFVVYKKIYLNIKTDRFRDKERYAVWN